MSTVIFTVDPKIKMKAMRRAKKRRVPFSSVLKHATKAFAEGRFSMGLIEEVRPEKLRLWERISRDYDKGKGRQFASAREAMEFVENL